MDFENINSKPDNLERTQEELRVVHLEYKKLHHECKNNLEAAKMWKTHYDNAEEENEKLKGQVSIANGKATVWEKRFDGSEETNRDLQAAMRATGSDDDTTIADLTRSVRYLSGRIEKLKEEKKPMGMVLQLSMRNVTLERRVGTLEQQLKNASGTIASLRGGLEFYKDGTHKKLAAEVVTVSIERDELKKCNRCLDNAIGEQAATVEALNAAVLVLEYSVRDYRGKNNKLIIEKKALGVLLEGQELTIKNNLITAADVKTQIAKGCNILIGNTCAGVITLPRTLLADVADSLKWALTKVPMACIAAQPTTHETAAKNCMDVLTLLNVKK